MNRRRRAVGLRVAIAITTLLAGSIDGVASAAPPRRPPPQNGSAKQACLAAHEAAQSLRTQQKPHAALEKFAACARVECPTLVRKECLEQVELVGRDAPTVALEAHDESGADTTEVIVSLDGAKLADRLTGVAVDVEPGEHVFHFQRGDGKAIDQRVLVVEGDKNRKVLADFASLVPRPIGPEPKPETPPPHKPVPVLAYVAGGVAIVALGSFAFFAVSGKGSEKDLASSCEPTCTQSQLTPIKRDYLIADISLVLGVAAAATALVLAWPSLSGPSQKSASMGPAQVLAPPPWMPRVRVLAVAP